MIELNMGIVHIRHLRIESVEKPYVSKTIFRASQNPKGKQTKRKVERVRI